MPLLPLQTYHRSRKHRSLIQRRIAAAGLPLAALALLAGCATTHSRTAPVAPARLPLTAQAVGSLHAEGLNTVNFMFTVKIDNPNSEQVRVESTRSRLMIASVPEAACAGSGNVSVPAKGSASLRIDCSVDAQQLYRTLPELTRKREAPWNFDATMQVTYSSGATGVVHAATEGSFPIVREPTVRIVSLRIERYDLIETKLSLTVDVSNPNLFPVTFESMQYEFSAEDRVWGDGTVHLPQPIGPVQTGAVQIPLRLNFIDMGRRVLDLVASLGTVSYHLTGHATVRTPTDLIPEFLMEFDHQGRIKVQK